MINRGHYISNRFKNMKIVASVLFFLALLIGTLCPSSEAQSIRSRYRSSSGASLGPASKQSQSRSLELKVQIDARSAVGTSHEWMQALSEVGADRVIAETSKVREPSFKETGSGNFKTLSITGIVKRGTLYLPGGKFKISQTAAIRNHLRKLRDDGAEVTIAEKVAFGLTAKQLLSVHDALGATLNTSTKGKRAATLARQLLELSGFETVIDNSARRSLNASNHEMQVELDGFSLGTSLALTLRTMGLVFEPIRPQGKQVQLRIRTSDDNSENWPVGWPVSESLSVAAPKLRIKVPIQAQGAEILKLLQAIEGRVEIPFVFDDRNIGQKGIDLESTKVTYTRAAKSSYERVIDKVLNQCKPKLKSELRIDEVGKRFLWITPR